MEKPIKKIAQAPTDLILLIAFISFLAIMAIITTLVYSKVSEGFLSNSLLNQSQEQRDAFNLPNTVNAMWDYTLLAIMIGILLATLITAYFIDVHSIFMVLYIFGLVIGEVISAILSFIWHTVSINPAINEVLYLFPITDNILSNLPYYFAIIGVCGLILTYAKDTSG